MSFGTRQEIVQAAFRALDWQESVLDKDLAIPPALPAVGDRFIVAAGGVGLWAGLDDDIVEWTGGAWANATPDEGTATRVEDENLHYQFTAGAWALMGGVAPAGPAGGELGGNYPNPTVNDGADATAIHDDTAAEISAVAAKAPALVADFALIEDSADADAKKRITLDDIPGVPFGDDDQYDANDGTFSTSSGTYVPIPSTTITTPVLTGTYIVYWQTRLHDNGRRIAVRLQETVGATTLDEAIERPQQPGERRPASGFVEVAFVAESKTFRLEGKDDQGGGTSVDFTRSRVQLFQKTT